MSKPKASTAFKVWLEDGTDVVVLARSAKGAASYAAQVQGLPVDHRRRPEPTEADDA